MRQVRSRGVLFAAGVGAVGLGRSCDLTTITEGFVGGGRLWNDDRLREKCRKELGTNSARSWVEMMV
jgi:hypothetical protein